MYKIAYRYGDEVVFYFDYAGNKYVASGGNLVQHPLNPLNICLVFFRILNFAYHAYIPM